MITSELITPTHLARTAIIYVRQSTPQQTISHQESLRLQYALKQHAVSLGWRPDDVVVIDTDLGVTAASAEHREGFKEVIAQVTLGQVGIILSYDVTRLVARLACGRLLSGLVARQLTSVPAAARALSRAPG